MSHKPFRKKLRGLINHIYDTVMFPLWLVFQCARHRKKAVIICRTGVLGDIICTLPLCSEIRKRHPENFIIFVTNQDYKSMVLLSREMDEVYGAKSWVWPFFLPDKYNFWGLVEAIYNPRTTGELSKNGPKSHLMDDLAGSCGITLSNPHPQLMAPPDLLKSVQIKYGLVNPIAKGRLIIAINCGRTWPVRMWDAAKWQALVDKIHAEFDPVILQFGFTGGNDDEYEQIRGVHRFQNWMQLNDLVALIASCRLIVSTDSGPVHLAGALGVPVVGLYGALNPQYFLPRSSPAVGVFSNVPCLFCHHATPRGHWQTGCPNDIRCMKELDVETVFEAVKKMLASAG